MTGLSEPEQSVLPVLSQQLIGIVVALPEELATLTRRKLKQGETLAISEQILIAYAGAGPANATSAAQILCKQGVTALISWGCAAALTEHLKPGDLVIPKQVSSENDRIFQCDQTWLTHAQTLFSTSLRLTTGDLHESNSVISGSAEKQRIHRETGAVALDMESGAVFQIAQQAGISCLAIRAIADPVFMNLPKSVIRSLQPDGRVAITKLFKYLLINPQEIPDLIKLGLHFQAAKKTLRVVANRLKELISFNNHAKL